jgi:hypothetical protein
MNKIAVVFNVPTMTPASYHQVIKDLESSGAGHPQGRLSHVATTAEQGMVVVDIYDSMDSFAKFGGTLIPILVKNGITPPNPQVLAVENEIVPPGK